MTRRRAQNMWRGASDLQPTRPPSVLSEETWGAPIGITPEVARQLMEDMNNFFRRIGEYEMSPIIQETQRSIAERFAVPTSIIGTNGNEEDQNVSPMMNKMNKRKERTAESAILLETGEFRDGVSKSSRVFFVYVTPTGAEIPLSKCPALTKTFTQADGGFGGSTRKNVAEYLILGKSRVKMVNLQSVFGRPKRVVQLYIDIDPEDQVIEIKGLGGFGKFTGRGRIDMKTSAYSVNRETRKFTEKVLEEHFDYRVIRASKRAGIRSVRSLIFE